VLVSVNNSFLECNQGLLTSTTVDRFFWTGDYFRGTLSARGQHGWEGISDPLLPETSSCWPCRLRPVGPAPEVAYSRTALPRQSALRSLFPRRLLRQLPRFSPEDVETLFCSPWCQETAGTVRYLRCVFRNGRIDDPDVQVAVRARQAVLLSGGCASLGIESLAGFSCRSRLSYDSHILKIETMNDEAQVHEGTADRRVRNRYREVKA